VAFTDNKGLRLHWDEGGSGSPLLLVMGATYSSAMWYPVLSALTERHRVVWFDNRGIGQSQGTRTATISDFAADARAVMDAAGLDTAHVFGVSLGGVIVEQLALESPGRMRSLILGCTGILSDDKPRAPKSVDLMLRLPRRVLLSMANDSAYGPACTPQAAAKDRAALRAERTTRLGMVAQQRALRAYSVSLPQIATLAMPVLVQHGTADRLVPVAWGRELAETLPSAQLVTYDGAGHNYLVAAGDRASADILEFLERVDAAQAAQASTTS
jgi:3-oxoadipate enol-lactonase